MMVKRADEGVGAVTASALGAEPFDKQTGDHAADRRQNKDAPIESQDFWRAEMRDAADQEKRRMVERPFKGRGGQPTEHTDQHAEREEPAPAGGGLGEGLSKARP
ncbi:MAG: hypothetical protein HBSAPP02_00750 [Phycisphaerae bacterium]|nr:MAG: hypothetical protein HBSAPP02_00750 [Phycisphaerae bacterium]